MAQSQKLVVQQDGPGGTLRARVQLTARNPTDDNVTYVVLGTTSTAVPPATLGDVAGQKGGLAPTLADTFWDSVVNQFACTSNAGVQNVLFQDQYILQGAVRLDVNYAVGQYVWALGFPAGGVPVVGDAPSLVSGPYLII